VTGIQPAPELHVEASGAGSAGIEPPEGINPNAGAEAALPIPAGGTAAQVALGDRVFHGKAGGGTCVGCHGADGKGTPLGPRSHQRQMAVGQRQCCINSTDHHSGVPEPKKYRSTMPPMGGAQLSPSEVSAVAAYVWALNHQKHN
jgi:mono/diheme cytochrome c family protein